MPTRNSSGTAISERLYVEDLHGAGHHVDIYSTLTPKDKRGTTLWPMGWHAGAIVLALFPACTFEPAGLTPTEVGVVTKFVDQQAVHVFGRLDAVVNNASRRHNPAYH